MFPPAVAVALTVVCVATGALALTRLVTPACCTPGRTEGRATELLHVLMSVAMVAMTWGLAGGPDTVDGAAQIAVFGAFTAGFVVLAARAVGPLRLVRSAHALMAAAMVWMVALMPTLMHAAPAAGVPAAGGHSGHGDHGMGAGHGMPDVVTAVHAAPDPAGTSLWVPATTVLAVVLLVAALAWGVRAAQAASPAHRAPAAPAASPAPAGAPVAVLAPATAVTAPRVTSAPLAASCHGLMSLAMAAMLVAML